MVMAQSVKRVKHQKRAGGNVKMNADDVTNGVACTLKPPVFLHLGGEDAKTHTRCSGVCVIDVTLPPGKTVNIETIDFKNFYTALVSVRLQKRSPGQEGAAAEWRTALGDRPLMSNPHTEAGAQDYYSIHRNQMRVEPDDVSSVRLILKQPSSAWSTFGVEDVRISPHTQPEPDKELSDWLLALNLVDPDPHVPGPVDAASVSCSLQQMWALTQVMQSSQSSTTSVGRFDVDGCYDISLLSLT
ncbi:nicolin-1 isoform X3 [Phyllopteryx taeniolatus]|uniref:nicolin-1 isoform X3 n=1 Tax=Phyllopteryx taeniolatus TaxID=161469 RepID=UPI002AD45794|nr:nicolin-1 isoform X3 [Phyllopteryx taeniolatus]